MAKIIFLVVTIAASLLVGITTGYLLIRRILQVFGHHPQETAAAATVVKTKAAGNDDQGDRSWRSVLKRFHVTVANPRLIPQGLSCPFMVFIYLPWGRTEVERQIRKDIGDSYVETVDMFESSLQSKIRVELESQAVEFTKPVCIELTKSVNRASFLGRPISSCHSGIHKVKVNIEDDATNTNLYSAYVDVRVVDYAFDHVPRPLISKATAAVFGLGSLVTYFLTLLGKFDATFGWGSGTAAAAIAVVIHANMLQRYSRKYESLTDDRL
jgi:hypothetical protein